MKKKVLVINYHQIDTGKDTGIPAIDKVFAVSRASFENQVKILIENKIPVISLRDLINNNISSDFSVAVTIDDGNYSDYDIIYPILKANNITATFFWLANNKSDLINRDQINEMVKHGFSIASHGITHRDLTKLCKTDQQHELEFSKRCIEEKINQSVDYFSFPFGMYNRETIELAKNAGYKAVLTTDVKLNNPESRPFLIHRWSVKRSTTFKEFEGLVTNKNVLKRKIITSKIMIIAKKILGRSISDRLNILVHS